MDTICKDFGICTVIHASETTKKQNEKLIYVDFALHSPQPSKHPEERRTNVIQFCIAFPSTKQAAQRTTNGIPMREKKILVGGATLPYLYIPLFTPFPRPHHQSIHPALRCARDKHRKQLLLLPL
jgi:hypothetical protein